MRTAIIGGGIAGLAAAYELEQARQKGAEIEYTLFEARARLGGCLASEIVNGAVLERGPDSFLSEKPAAAELCRELGLGGELTASNDAERKTYIVVRNRLVALPDGLMFLVPTKLIQAEEVLRERFALLVSIPGIAEISALQILSELVLLPPGMTVRQWVAYSGLAPVFHPSNEDLSLGTPVFHPSDEDLSLGAPVLSAARYDPHLRAFYQALRERHKTGLQALMAVERKLLHAIYGIFKSGRPYDGRRLFPQIQLAVESIAG
jgi:hypothetical protein